MTEQISILFSGKHTSVSGTLSYYFNLYLSAIRLPQLSRKCRKIARIAFSVFSQKVLAGNGSDQTGNIFEWLAILLRHPMSSSIYIPILVKIYPVVLEIWCATDGPTERRIDRPTPYLKNHLTVNIFDWLAILLLLHHDLSLDTDICCLTM